MDLLHALGRVIRCERQRRGLTQEELAERANLHINIIGLIERGRNAAAVDTLAAIAYALDRRPSQLLRAAEREMLQHGV